MAVSKEKVSFDKFKKIYDRNVNDIYALWTPDMQSKISKHNVDWATPYSFENYLYRSVNRFYKAYLAIPFNVSNCLDVGGFWGVFPTTLTDLGYDVTMTEAKKYYDSSFDHIFKYIESRDVHIKDVDPFEEPLSGSFDYVSVMAVLEHIPFSLKFFMNNLKSIMSEYCTLYVDVPNIAYYFKRKDLLLGRTPLPNVLSIYNSETPFIGHHHEFTVKELVDLLNQVGLTIVKIETFNYSIEPSLKFAMSNPLAYFCMRYFPSMREVVSATTRKEAHK